MSSPAYKKEDFEPPSIAELRESAEQRIEAESSAAPQPAPEDPRDHPEWSFEFRYTDTRGKAWVGTFTNTILSPKIRREVENLCARLAGGLPFESIAPAARFVNRARAHLEWSLKRRPDWAKSMDDVDDDDVVLALFEKARSHEDRYFRRPEVPDGG